MTVFGIDLWWSASSIAAGAPAGAMEFLKNPAHWRFLADLGLLSVFSGFYIVPLYALIQSRSEPALRSRTIAGNNIINALFMIAASVLAIGFFAAGLTIPQLFLVTALLNAAVAVYIYKLVPEFLMRFMAWLLIHSVYRVEKSGIDSIPEEGPAVLVCNHISYVDALVISAACPRPIRWVMDHRIFRVPLLSFFFRTARAIPIASAKEDPDVLQGALDAVAEALEKGELVGIFPEGRLTPDGEIGQFRGGISRIVTRTPVPVIPMALSGLWDSLFARHPGKTRRAPGRLFPKVRLTVSSPVRPEAAAPDALRTIVAGLRGEWR